MVSVAYIRQGKMYVSKVFRLLIIEHFLSVRIDLTLEKAYHALLIHFLTAFVSSPSSLITRLDTCLAYLA